MGKIVFEYKNVQEKMLQAFKDSQKSSFSQQNSAQKYYKLIRHSSTIKPSLSITKAAWPSGQSVRL